MLKQPAEILVVDDEPQVLSMLAAVLDSPSRRCLTASSAREALDLLCRHDIAVIVSDIAMPEMTGMELLARIRSIRPQTPTILITGAGSSMLAKEAIRRGAFDYIEKPFDIDELRRMVDAAVVAARDRGWADNGAEPPLHDPLTGLMSHRAFVEELGRLRARCRRSNQPVTLLLLDIQRFRAVNELFGHICGDRLLEQVAARLRGLSRAADVVARYAWDQFVIAMPDTPAESARSLADRCIQAIGRAPFDCHGNEIRCQISIGLAECESGFIENEADLLRRSGEALAEAKARGGNAVVSWSELAPRDPEALRPDLPGILEMRRRFQSLEVHLKQAYLESTRAIVAAVEAKDPYTEKHSLTVAHYASAFARHLDLPAAQVDTISIAAILHDVGKIGVPDSILTKPDRLTDEEFALVKRHPVMGVQILEHISFLRAEIPIILHHHERWDGRGYPANLAGESIPLGARILHVADALDAMLSVRSYKNSYPLTHVIAELERCAGSQFDPEIVRRAVEWIKANGDQVVYPRDRERIVPCLTPT